MTLDPGVSGFPAEPTASLLRRSNSGTQLRRVRRRGRTRRSLTATTVEQYYIYLNPCEVVLRYVIILVVTHPGKRYDTCPIATPAESTPSGVSLAADAPLLRPVTNCHFVTASHRVSYELIIILPLSRYTITPLIVTSIL